jgi:hypothetical protein
MIPISPPESTRWTPRFPNDDNGAMVNVAPRIYGERGTPQTMTMVQW